MQNSNAFQILGQFNQNESQKRNTTVNPSITDEIGDLVFNIPEDKTTNLIKVIGVGGGGGNAVRNMYEQQITNVSFAVCNTDSQALSKSPIPMKVSLGPEGLGVGGNPERGRQMAEASIDDIECMLGKDTQMLFLTAGMGGGTGTGAAPVIAHVARERGILTVGVVTLPFAFEKRQRQETALMGVEMLRKEVDSLLVINNEQLLKMHEEKGGIPIEDAFREADQVLTTATKSIAEIITLEGKVNRDFNDVKTVMKDGGSAIMSVGYGSGENRLIKAMQQALQSPLLNRLDIPKAKKLLYIIYTCKDAPVMTNELKQVNDFMDTLNRDLLVLWGLYSDDTIGNQVKVAIIATGFDTPDQDTPDENAERQTQIEELRRKYYGTDLNENTPHLSEQENTEPVTESEAEYENPADEDQEPAVKKSWLDTLVDVLKQAVNE